MRGIIRPATILALAWAILPAAHSGANHIAGATYDGSIDGGGTIQFTISADGSSVSSIKVTDVPGDSCTFPESSQTGAVPIFDHAFSDTTAPLKASGTFPGPQSAQGTVQVTSFGFPSCDTGVKSWSAMTTATPPPGGATTVSGVKAKVKPASILVSGKVVPAAPGAKVVATLFAKGSPFKKVAKRTDTLDDAGRFKVKLPHPDADRCKVVVQFKGDATHEPSKATKKFAC